LIFCKEYLRTLEKLFQEFDYDGSGSLDKQELLTMFNKYGIRISQQEMDAFFAYVDRNNDRSLNREEFKKCISDEKANKFFSRMMLKLRKRELR
jgi:Ca2+-binding EF-hand superfamily protein